MAESPLKVAVLPVTPFQQNCSLVWCTSTGAAAFIDPGGEVDRLLEAARSRNLAVEKILLTHGHLDHAGGAARLARALKVPIEGPHRDDGFLLEALAEHGARYGFQGSEACSPDRWLENGDTAQVGNVAFAVRHCPGHTPGHVVFVQTDLKIAFVGDVLFSGSIGRTDLPRGNHAQLIHSITERLWPLGEEVRFVPGHGQTSTFGWERKCNPFVSDLALGR